MRKICLAVAMTLMLLAFAMPAISESALDITALVVPEAVYAQIDPAKPEAFRPESDKPEAAKKENKKTDEPKPAIEPEDESLVATESIIVQTPQAERLSVHLNGHDILFPGQSVQATADIFPKSAGQSVAWSTSNTALLTVDGNGLATASAYANLPVEGAYVDLWARTLDRSLVMNCRTILLLPGVSELQCLLNDMTVSIADADRSAIIPLAIIPSELSGIVPIQWQSSDENIVRVFGSGSSGEIARIFWSDVPGSAVITAQAQDGSYRSAQFTVTVNG